ncbi:MAG TPA: hypothetical protein VIL27_10310 [Clostridia bacterium]
MALEKEWKAVENILPQLLSILLVIGMMLGAWSMTKIPLLLRPGI